jgi:hypothetical protein
MAGVVDDLSRVGIQTIEIGVDQMKRLLSCM